MNTFLQILKCLSIVMYICLFVNFWDDRGNSLLVYISVIFILSVGGSFCIVIGLYALREVLFGLMSIGG